MNKTLTQEQRINIVRYRIESAENTLAEVETHRANGFYRISFQKFGDFILYLYICSRNDNKLRNIPSKNY